MLVHLTWYRCLYSHVSTFSLYPGATPNGNPLATFSNVTGSPFIWTQVNYASGSWQDIRWNHISYVIFSPGTSLDLTLRDNTGLSAQSAPFTVQSGGMWWFILVDLAFLFSLGSTTCLNGTASGSNGGTAATPAATSPTSAAATTPTGTTPAGSQSKAGAGTTGTSYVSVTIQWSTTNPRRSTAKSSSSSGNAAIVASIPYGMAGVLGAFVAAVFVWIQWGTVR